MRMMKCRIKERRKILILKNDIDDFVGEIDDSEDKEVVNDAHCKFTYNMIWISFLWDSKNVS